MPYTCDGETKFNPHNDVVALWTEHSLYVWNITKCRTL